jgi:hypothetical protein
MDRVGYIEGFKGFNFKKKWAKIEYPVLQK